MVNPGPSNPVVPQGLINLLTSGEFVLFLGAGVGVEAGFPTWEGALIQLADQLRPHNAPYANLIANDARAGRFLQAAELLQLAGVPETDRAKMLQAVFDKEPQITRRSKLLALTRCQGIVTTNFDRSLPVAAAEAQAQLTVYGESDQDLAAARVANRPFLVRLHGRSEVPETLIFADRHYRSVLDRGPYVEFFRELFVQRNIVFFGFSFSDPVLFGLVQSMSAAVRSLFRREAFALMAAPVDSKLAQTLVDCGVKVVQYDPADRHAEAWDLFAQYRNGPPAVTPEVYEVQQIRSHLAAAYARARGREFRADRERMLSALMLPVLAEYGQNTVVSLETFLGCIEDRLALPRSFDRGHLVESVKLLERDGLLILQGTNLLVGDVTPSQDLLRDANRLVDGVIARAKIRFQRSELESQRDLLAELVVTALSLDGLHLAHTIIRHQPLEAERMDRVIAEAIQRVKFPRAKAELATAAFTDLITSPDPEEEQILTNIAAVVFGTTLLLTDPLLAEQVATPFERGAYVDASVLLPWLAEGHPLRRAYDSVFRSFDSTGVRVLSGYLNEVVSHRRLAIDTFGQSGFDDLNRFKRYAALFELHNINVFLGGYAGMLQEGSEETFDQYLGRVAPFESETQLKKLLEGLGLVVEDYKLKDYGLAGELKAALKDKGKVREDVVIAHDAAQLELLRSSKDPSRRPFFITADRALVSAVSSSETSRNVILNVLLPQQVAFLAQMADRQANGFQAFSRTLWTVGASVAEKVKKYYTDRVLREYEEGLVAEIDRILEAIIRDLKSEGVSLDDDLRDPRTETTRLKLFERLDRFEPRFFQHMAEARERSKKRQS